LIQPPKAATLNEEVQRVGQLAQLPNVTVHARRVTPIDKDAAVGRWKVIRAELEKRGLPLKGHRHLAKHKEKQWALGKA
jgi:hypothetical protein